MDVFSVSQHDLLGTFREKQLFVPAFSGTFSLAFEWKRAKLSFNYTGKIMGPQHLPEFNSPYERPAISPWYSQQNFQVTKKFSSPLEIFGGVKNLLNWTQPTPLINPQNPYDSTFDTSYVYGPLQPIRFYLGIRYQLQRKS